MVWISAALLVSLVANVVVVVHFLDIVTSERDAHREEIRALLAKAGVPVVVGGPREFPLAPPRDPSKFIFDPTGLDDPIEIEDE